MPLELNYSDLKYENILVSVSILASLTISTSVFYKHEFVNIYRIYIISLTSAEHKLLL